jgi:hypothetical protein
MQDRGKILAQVYELILGREVMNAIVGIGQYDNTLAVQIMGLAVRARLGDMPAEEARQEIDLLIADYEQLQISLDEEE